MRKGISLFRKLSSVVLTLAMVAGLGAGYVPATKAPVEEVQAATSAYPYRNVMYYGDWSIYAGQKNFTVEKIDGSLITHLNFAFLDADANGDLITTDTWADYQNPNVGYSVGSDNKYAGVLGAMILLRQKYPNMKIGISVGGWTRSGDFPKLAANATTRNNFAQNVAKFVHYYGYDFVDIDWEYPTADRDPDPVGNGVEIDKGCKGSPADTQNFTLLMQAIRDALDSYGAQDGKYYELSVAMSASPTMMDAIEYDKVLKIVDFANMMTYDLNGAWAPWTAHQTALYTNDAYDPENQKDAALSVDSCIKFLENKYGNSIDYSKVVVGVAPYTRGWKSVDQSTGRDPKCPGLYATATGENGVTYAYGDINQLINQYQLTKYWDDEAKAHYFYSPTTGYFFTCDTEESVAEKGKYVKEKGLGGLISWMASLDSTNSVTKAMKQALYGNNAIPTQTIVAPKVEGISIDVAASGDTYTFTLKNNNSAITLPGGAKDISVMPWAETFGKTLSYPGLTIELHDGTTLTNGGSDWSAGGKVTTSGKYTKVLTNLYDDKAFKPGTSKTFTLKTSSGTASVSNVKSITLTQRVNDGQEEISPVVIYGSGSAIIDPTTQAQQQTTQAQQQTTQTQQQTTVSQQTTQNTSGGTSYPTWSANSVHYTVGTIIQYEGKVYETVIEHTSHAGWPPNGGGSTLFKERTDLVAGSGGSEETTATEETTTYRPTNTNLPEHMVTGYWHNFLNGSSALRLSDVPLTYDMVCVAFANSTTVAGRLTFDIDGDLSTALGGYSKADFIKDIQTLRARGQHVIISVGGAEGTTYIKDQASSDEFATSLIQMIKEYGFEGVDIDFEGAAVSGTAYIASALRKVHAEFGDDLIITMAPETYYMHDANDLTGAYFRLAMEIKDILTICYPQFYNAGGDIGYGGFNARYPSVSFITSLASMYIENGLRPDQLAIGLPSCPKAASNGYMANDDIITAINSLVYKQTADGFTPPRGYETLRGVMTWSINWDQTTSYAWANAMSSLMDSLPTHGVTNPETTTQKQTTTQIVARPTEVTGLALQSKDTTSATITWSQTTTQMNAGQKYKVYVDGALYGTYDSAQTLKINLATGSHTIKVTGTLNGYETTGSTVNVEIEAAQVGGTIDVIGFQISTVNKGVRTVYSVSNKINGKDVVSSGVIYSLTDKISSTDEIKVGSTNKYVIPYTSTSVGLLPTVITPSSGASVDKTYAMTMRFGSDTVKAYTGSYTIKVFAKLSDGSYVYSDAFTYSAYSISETLYKNNMMPSYSDHQFLYNNILNVVTPGYKEVEYDWGNTMTK